MLRYAANRAPDVRYHTGAMAKLAPFMTRYWWHSAPARYAAIARANATLIKHCVNEHRALADAAGGGDFLRGNGWIKIFRTGAKQDEETRAAEFLRREFDVEYQALDAGRVRAVVPHLGQGLIGGLHFTDAVTVGDPQALVRAYARYFETLGGRVFLGGADQLAPQWRVSTHDGPLQARTVVVAMGPWSDRVALKFGYKVPFAVKRGYHMHYATAPGVRLGYPVLDVERGFLISPMARGVRLTTGIELGLRDTAKTPVQLAAVEPAARELFPLGARLDDEPWMGCRPCTPDMLPIIGPAPRHAGLWFAFGHAHLGLTLGPVTGRLIAELITGDETICDPAPFRMQRFSV